MSRLDLGLPGGNHSPPGTFVLGGKDGLQPLRKGGVSVGKGDGDFHGVVMEVACAVPAALAG
jgi:hypothetical protein